jgi:hypothetical protein
MKSTFDEPLPEFPPRTLTSIGNFDPEFIEERRRKLVKWFRQLKQMFFEWEEMLNFFEVKYYY